MILLVICVLLSIGAEGCPWTRNDPDITTGSSGEPKPAQIKPLESGSSAPQAEKSNSE